MFWQDNELLLDAVDHARQYPWKGRSSSDAYNPKSTALELKSYLDDARSVYDVIPISNRDYDSPAQGNEHELAIPVMGVQTMMPPMGDYYYQLGYRQPQEISKLAEDATSDRSRASEHLRSAWSSAFSRKANMNAACFAAVKAIEAAARDTIEPKKSKPTLGTMISAMKDKRTKWQTDLGSPDSEDITMIISMMNMVWKGHSRHSNPDELIDVPPERCEMIVHSAALLVHWFSSGKVRRA